MALIALAGCVNVLPRDPGALDIPLPHAWLAHPIATDGMTVEGWIETFHDANLSALIHEALRRNYDLKAAAARVEAARAQARIEGASRLPQLAFAALVLMDVANAEAQLAQARNQVEAASRQLEVLLGRYPEGKSAPGDQLPTLPELVPAGLPGQLLGRRPDLRAAFARLQAEDWRVASAQAALLPTLTLTGSGGLRSGELRDLVDPGSAAWSAAGGLLQPLFTGGLLRNAVRLNRARVEEALNRYQGTALAAFREVEQALAAEEWLLAQEWSLGESVRQTEASRKLAVYSYRHGFIDILTLLDSYRSTLNAESAHLAVKREILTNRINLYLALGGRWESASTSRGRALSDTQAGQALAGTVAAP